MVKTENIDRDEIEKFDQLASGWWDPEGDFKPLHEINPLRLQFIEEKVELSGLAVVDIGCGGGILSESMAVSGAQVTGIDMASATLSVARAHAKANGLKINYQEISAEAFALKQPGSFDIITCMELLEHVPDPSSVIQACASLVKPDGHVFFSTINRNPKSYLFAILGAEYLLRLLPKGTHDYGKFIRPSELESWARRSDLVTQDLIGMTYNPLTQVYKLSPDVDVNYLIHCIKKSG